MTLPTTENIAEILAGATKGRRVQFHPKFCKEAEGTPPSEWDTSHDTSLIREDGSRHRGYSTHKHSGDALLDNMAYALAERHIADTALIDALKAAPLSAAVAYEKAAEALRSEFKISSFQVDGNEVYGADSGTPAACYGIIRALPIPTEAELDAAALARPVVRALVEALERIAHTSDFYGVEANAEDQGAGTLAYAHKSTCNLAHEALAPFTEASA